MNMNIYFTLFMICLMTRLQKCITGNVNTSHDDVIRRRIEQFIERCPETSTCSQYAKGLPEGAHRLYNHKPCCQACSCSDDCGFNCCPDRSGKLETEEALYNASRIVRCIDSQHRRYDPNKHNGLSYRMVSDCPYHYRDTDIQTKCRREYSDISFDVPLRYILPVFDNLTNLNYKNIYCAQCHNVELKRLEFASLNYECYASHRFTVNEGLTYIRDLSANLDSNGSDRCNILFTPYKGNACNRNFIDRCNLTGQWFIYDRETETSCLSYTSVYTDKFKNIHCYICNGFKETDIEYSCQTDYASDIEGYFITIIDFSRPPDADVYQNVFEINEIDVNNSCHPNSIYDTEKRSEWNLQCPVGMTLSKWYMMCQPKETSQILSISLEISLIPDPHSRTKDSLQNILLYLTKQIKDKTELLVTKDVSFGRIQGAIHFKEDFRLKLESNKQISLRFIRSIDVRIEIMMNKANHVRLFETVLDFTLVFTKLLRYGNFVANFRQFDSEVYDKQHHSYKCWRDSSLPEVKLCMHEPDQTSDTFSFYILNDTIKSMSSIGGLNIEPEPFCPRVVIPKLSFADDINICNESKHLASILTDVFVSKALRENSTHLFFCHEDYFQHITNLPTNTYHVKDEEISSPDINLSTIMYMAISCLSVSLLSLIFTLIVYSVFKDLRTLPGMNNMALVTSLFAFQTMSLVNTITDIKISWLCSFFAIVTHFSFVKSFSWMFICTYHMLKVFMNVRNRAVPRNDSLTFTMYTIFTTSVATVAVVATVITADVQSSGNDIGYGGYGCYIKNPVMVMCAAAIPAAIIIVLNLGMFCITVFKISKHPSMSSAGATERSNIAIFAKLSTLTGLTWIFGFMFVFTKVNAFAYIFVTLNAGQGLFIMLSFVCNRRVLRLIHSKFSEQTAASQSLSIRVGNTE
ncbi:uncharacterized protein LOC123529170 [Mercenaria mercenaria]|uniref:uncharacterized protein LOC123529170 n=1 Tax=Mercenaria mercenaria TaxID=6596 RepID=UPI00234EE07B|nr:uncharacterized protein LOC123529170 [Mercenaria mercenaria]